MVPSTGEALLILLVAVLPGAMFTFGFERQAGAFGVTLADRVLRFVTVSAVFDVVYAWPAYALCGVFVSNGGIGASRFAALWAAVVAALALPAGLGTVVGGLYATRRTRTGWAWVRRHLSAEREVRLLRLVLGPDPAPRAWDHVFSERPVAYLRVGRTDGGWIGGAFGENSYAGGFPQDGDLFLEEAWPVDPEGSFGDSPLVTLSTSPRRRSRTSRSWSRRAWRRSPMAEGEKKAGKFVPRFEKRGGYSGGGPVSEMPPPPTTPSGSVPAAQRKTKKAG